MANGKWALVSSEVPRNAPLSNVYCPSENSLQQSCTQDCLFTLITPVPPSSRPFQCTVFYLLYIISIGKALRWNDLGALESYTVQEIKLKNVLKSKSCVSAQQNLLFCSCGKLGGDVYLLPVNHGGRVQAIHSQRHKATRQLASECCHFEIMGRENGCEFEESGSESVTKTTHVSCVVWSWFGFLTSVTWE